MPNSSADTFDAIVVGSGLNGSVAAKTLSEAGLRVLVLEAGPAGDPRKLYRGRLKQLVRGYYRGMISGSQAVQSLQPLFWGLNPDLFIDDRSSPYTTEPGQDFTWIRSRMVGGRSLTWGGRTVRMSDWEFKAASRDGFGDDWPIGHDDLAPYYDEIESLFGVRGGTDNLPHVPDGRLASPEGFSPAEEHVRDCVKFRWPERAVICARGIDSTSDHRWSSDKPWPSLSTPATSLERALATGRTTVRPESAVSHLLVDRENGIARGVAYADRSTKALREVFGRMVVLCASTIETVRILLQSGRAEGRADVFDRSGTLGRYLMDHVSTSRSVYFPQLPPPQNQHPMHGCSGLFIPRFQNLENPHDKPYLRGFGIACALQRGGRLPDFLHRRVGGSHGFIAAHGEMLPRFDNAVTLNRNVLDSDGRAVPHIACRWSDNEAAMADDMNREIANLLACSGGEECNLSDLLHLGPMARPMDRMQASMRKAAPGYFVHEVGGARMGSQPAVSVVNLWNQLWGLPNVLVTDGACWVTSGWQNPTLTQMAITARACHAAARASAKGDEAMLRS